MKNLHLLDAMEIHLVGSARTKQHPRDLDLVGVVKDKSFYRIFGLPALKFIKELNTGDWGPEMGKWSDYCVLTSRVFQNRLSTPIPVDFKIFPETYFNLVKENLEIEEEERPLKWKKKFREEGSNERSDEETD